MIRKLLIVFASGLLLAIVSLGGAWAVGGPAFMQHVKAEGWDADWDVDGGDGRSPDGPGRVRTLVFDGDRALTIAMPVSLRFRRGTTSEMTVSGSPNAVDAVEWKDGRLSLRGGVHSYHDLHVTITAPRLVGLVLDAPGSVDLDDLDQPSFTLKTHGPAQVDASGKVGKLAIAAQGPADIDMADLAATDATVRVDGVGNVDIAASGTVDAELNGVGNVTLHRKPARLTSRTNGIGGIRHDYDGANETDPR